MKFSVLSLATLCGLSGIAEVYAQTADSAESLDPVVVTATRSARTVDEALAAVSVIDRDDIERLQVDSLQELLRGLPGLSISNNGGAGKATSVFIRGSESDHVLVLIDGIKVGSATLGTTAFQDIPLAQIERIEIVRGPRSSLYGSEAIGGVIQIFTRKGGGALRPAVSIGAGRYGTTKAEVALSAGGERGWFHLGTNRFDTDGFSACRGRPFPDGAGCFTFEPDDDGNRNLAASLRGGYRFDNGLSVDLQALRADADAEFDGSFVNATESVQQLFAGTIKATPISGWQLTANLGRNWDLSDNLLDGVRNSEFDTRRDSISVQNDFSLAEKQLLSIGIDYLDDRITSDTPFIVDIRDNLAVFAQYQVQFAGHDLQLSARHDDNEQFGNENTGGIAWGIALNDRWQLSASYGTAFKAPSFNELYFPDFGNPNLRPESSRSAELGLAGKWNNLRLGVNLFETRIDDLIAFESVTFLPANIDQVRIRGLELTGAIQLQDWVIDSSLTVLDPENRSPGDNAGNMLPRRAEQSLRIDIDRKFDALSIGATARGENRRFDDFANQIEIGGYATLDARIEYRFADAWRVQARLENLLDKRYETAAFFNQAARNWMLTLRYAP